MLEQSENAKQAAEQVDGLNGQPPFGLSFCFDKIEDYRINAADTGKSMPKTF